MSMHRDRFRTKRLAARVSERTDGYRFHGEDVEVIATDGGASSGKYRVSDVPSWADWVAHAGPETAPEGTDLGRLATDTWVDGNAWTFGQQGDAATSLAMLRAGRTSDKVWSRFTELRAALEPHVQKLAGAGQSARLRRLYTEEATAELDLDRYMGGDDRPWAYMHRSARSACVSLGVNVAVSCGNTEDSFLKSVALMTAGADLLAMQGYAVQLDAVHLGGHDSSSIGGGIKGTVTRIPLKGRNSPVDAQQVLGAALLGSYRYLGFAHYVIDQGVKPNSGLGHATVTPELEYLSGLDYMVSRDWRDGQEAEFLSELLETAKA